MALQNFADLLLSRAVARRYGNESDAMKSAAGPGGRPAASLRTRVGGVAGPGRKTRHVQGCLGNSRASLHGLSGADLTFSKWSDNAGKLEWGILSGHHQIARDDAN